MKSIIKTLLILALIFVVVTSGTPDKKNPIYGTWEISSGNHNGPAASQLMMDRIQYFNSDNTFKSVINAIGGKQSMANWGNFYLINDSTMITYHKDHFGKIDNVANTYTFKIRNDSLHFYGFYLRQISTNPPALIKVFIDEWWVKAKKQ
jgi:hypothetical protein